MYMYTHMYIYIHAHIHISISLSLYIYIYISIYLSIYIYIYTYIEQHNDKTSFPEAGRGGHNGNTHTTTIQTIIILIKLFHDIMFFFYHCYLPLNTDT